MDKLKIFCVTNKKISKLESSDLLLAGVGKENFSDRYYLSNHGDNIFEKEEYYSELTFHYWYWKNILTLKKENSKWIGFCQKRRFWIQSGIDLNSLSKSNYLGYLINKPEADWGSYESIICKPINVSGVKKIKLLKRGLKNILKNPKILIDKNLQTISLHFDMHHGYKNLNKAINLMDIKDREDFRNYVNKETKFNPHIMFISSPEIANKWFESLFDWLFKCESCFEFKKLKGYDQKRIFAYFGERYLSFWFKKYTKYKEQQWVFIDN